MAKLFEDGLDLAQRLADAGKGTVAKPPPLVEQLTLSLADAGKGTVAKLRRIWLSVI